MKKLVNCYLSLGSNVGDRHKNLQKTTTYIGSRLGIITAASPYYITEPWGNPEQEDYINQVLRLKTELSASGLLMEIQNIENLMGRTREQKWGCRIIDIDILFFGETIVQNEILSIPHPLIPQRRFVLEPLVEIEPDLIHPVLNKSMKELYLNCQDTSKVFELDTVF